VESLEDRRLLTVISVDTTWPLANSPYVLNSDVEVRNGATLTIESGVHVQGNGALRISDDGSNAALVANGVTFSDKVYLYPNAEPTLSGNTFSGGVDVAAKLVHYLDLAGNTFPTGTVNIQAGIITTNVTLPKISGVTTYSLDSSPIPYGLEVHGGGTLTIAGGNTIAGPGVLKIGDDNAGPATLQDDRTGSGGVTFKVNSYDNPLLYLYPSAVAYLSGDSFDSYSVDAAAQLVNSLANDTFPAGNATMTVQTGIITTAVTFPKIPGLTTYSLDSGPSPYGLEVHGGGTLTIEIGRAHV
jgi:hypothetical protein